RLLAPERVAAGLQGESARATALMLNALNPAQAGEGLKRLPAATRREGTLLLGGPLQMPMAGLQRVDRAIWQKSLAVEDRPADVGDDARYRKMADMLRLLDKPERLEILTAMEEKDADGALKVKEYLYQFEDLLRIDDRSMQKLLAEVDSKS